MTEGILYASETPQTAVAEMAFHRLLFFAKSPNTPWPSNPAEYTAFSAQYATKKAIDLTKRKYSADKARWTHVTDYSHCQAFADAARAAKIDVIRYASNSRSHPANKPRAAHLPRFRESQASQRTDMAYPPERRRGPSNLRGTKIRYHVRPQGLCC